MPIVCMFGPDGSGKTSIARKMIEELSSEGQKVRYSWMRGSHTLASLASRVFSKFDAFKGEENPYYGIRIPKNLVWVWQIMECVSVIPVVLLRFVLPHLSGFVVVADRYVIDFVVWVAMTTDDMKFLEGFSAGCAANLAKKCDALFFVTANPEELAARSGVSVDILEKQIELYRRVVEAYSLEVHIIETSEATVDDSMKGVLRVLNGGRL